MGDKIVLRVKLKFFPASIKEWWPMVNKQVYLNHPCIMATLTAPRPRAWLLRSNQETGAGFYHPASSLDLLTFSSIA